MCVCGFETRSHYIVWAGLEPTVQPRLHLRACAPSALARECCPNEHATTSMTLRPHYVKQELLEDEKEGSARGTCCGA